MTSNERRGTTVDISEVDPSLIKDRKQNDNDLLYYNPATGYYEWNDQPQNANAAGLILVDGQFTPGPMPLDYQEVYVGASTPTFPNYGWWVKDLGGGDIALMYEDGQ